MPASMPALSYVLPVVCNPLARQQQLRARAPPKFAQGTAKDAGAHTLQRQRKRVHEVGVERVAKHLHSQHTSVSASCHANTPCQRLARHFSPSFFLPPCPLGQALLTAGLSSALAACPAAAARMQHNTDLVRGIRRRRGSGGGRCWWLRPWLARFRPFCYQCAHRWCPKGLGPRSGPPSGAKSRGSPRSATFRAISRHTFAVRFQRHAFTCKLQHAPAQAHAAMTRSHSTVAKQCPPCAAALVRTPHAPHAPATRASLPSLRSTRARSSSLWPPLEHSGWWQASTKTAGRLGWPDRPLAFAAVAGTSGPSAASLRAASRSGHRKP